MISILKISKGNNSAKNEGGVISVMLLISARCLIMVYICAKFREIISNGIKGMERTRMFNL